MSIQHDIETVREGIEDWEIGDGGSINDAFERIVNRLGIVVCSYCGQESQRGTTPEETSQIVLDHIMTCEKNPMRDMAAALVTAQEVIAWFASDDTGVSSEALAATMMGVKKHWPTEPSDPGDLGRCIRLFDRFPLFRERLHEMKSQSERWSRLVDHWEELEALYREELPQGSAPKTYARMREIIHGYE